MTDRLPRSDAELLSAYFDGEVTAEERARVEALRTAIASVDAELESYGELSELMKSLPRETAPPEILSAVMQRAEQKSLLSAPAPAAARSWRTIRELGYFLAGAAVAAACITVGLRLREPQPEVLGGRVLNENHLAPAVVPMQKESRWSDGMVQFDAVSVPDSFHMEGMAENGQARLSRGDREKLSESVARAPTPASAAAGAPGPSSAGSGVANNILAMGEKETFSQGATVPLAEIVPLFAYESEGRVASVEVFSTNPTRSVDELQKILNDNGVHMADSAEDKPLATAPTLAKKSESEPQLPAVYVEAPTEPLSRSVEQWALQPEVVGVRLRPSLELPIELEPSEAIAGQRNQRLDVRRLKLAYEQSNSLETDGDLVADQNMAVSALEAVRNRYRESPAQNTIQREAKPNSSSFRDIQNRGLGSRAVAQEPIAPLTDSMGNTQRRLTLPLANSTNPRNFNSYYHLSQQTEATKQLSDETLLRQRVSNPVNLNTVRMLFVFQEANPTAAAPAEPAAPAKPPSATTAPANR